MILRMLVFSVSVNISAGRSVTTGYAAALGDDVAAYAFSYGLNSFTSAATILLLGPVPGI